MRIAAGCYDASDSGTISRKVCDYEWRDESLRLPPRPSLSSALPHNQGAKFMPKETVFKVQHVVLIDGAWMHAITDLIFDGKQPIAVLTWGGAPGKEHPLVSVPLDPAHLKEFRSGAVTHLYERPIDIPPTAH